MDKEIIIKNIGSSYNIDIVKLDMLRDGTDNVIWDATSRSGTRYAIRVSKRDVDGEIAFEAEWIRILQDEDIPVVPLVFTKTGNSYTNLDKGRAMTVFKFLPGRHLSVSIDNPPPQKTVEAAARVLAVLHSASKKHNVDLPRKRTVFKELERVIESGNLIIEKMPGGKDFIEEVRNTLKWGKSQMYDPVLVHNDYRIGNIMFDESDNLLAILDFDWSCIGPAIKDVAHSLAEWSFPDGSRNHNEQVFSGFLKSYNQASDAPMARDNFLYQWMALSCLSDACTFLIDRLLRGEIKPPSYSYMYKKYQYFLSMK